MPKIHTYFGVNIYPANERARACGVRWEANVNGNLRADTLQGIKQMIRDKVKPR